MADLIILTVVTAFLVAFMVVIGAWAVGTTFIALFGDIVSKQQELVKGAKWREED